jgi:hypothetical protein
MKQTANLRHFLIFCLFITAVLPVYSYSETQTFIDKAKIDSLVDNAFLTFSSITDPSSGITAENAIDHAKKIVIKLKKIAEFDANKKYILWKASEIEQQIFLEENGLMLEKQQWIVKQSNELIQRFNNENYSPHPSFDNLNNILKELYSVDSSKAFEMKKLILKRAENFTNIYPSMISTLIDKNMLDSARFELTYFLNNSKWLPVPVTTTASLEAALLAHSSLPQEKSVIETDLMKLDSLLHKSKLKDSRDLSRSIQFRLQKLKSLMIPLEWEKFNREYVRLDRKIDLKEDSLISIVFSRLRSKGPVEAGYFLDTIRSGGVTEEKIAAADRTILDKIIAQKKPDTVRIFTSSLSEDSSDSKPVFTELVLEAKKRSKAKQDSINALKEENIHLTQIEEVKRDRLRVAFEAQKKRSEEKAQMQNQQVQQDLFEIYHLLELKKVKEANQKFGKSNILLKQYLTKEEFDSLLVKLNSGK